MEHISDEQIKILGSIKDEELLLLIKEEAENFILGQVESESVILNKANNLFQILIAVFISISTYILSTYKDQDNILLYNTGVIFSVFIFLAIILLLFVINPKKIRLKGSVPTLLLNPDIFNGSDYDKIKFLKNRIFCLNRDIQYNSEKQKIRVRCYRVSVASIIMGLIYVAVIFASL